MAIKAVQQPRINLGGSSVQMRDTFTAAPTQDRGADGLNALSRSLEGFGGSLKEDHDRKQEQMDQEHALQRNFMATQIFDGLAAGEHIDVATGRLPPSMSRLNYAATLQAAGALAGKQRVEESLINFPTSLVDHPDQLAQEYEVRRRDLMSQHGTDNDFFNSGVHSAIEGQFNQHRQQQMAKSAAAAHTTQKEGFAQVGKDRLSSLREPPEAVTDDEIRTGAKPERRNEPRSHIDTSKARYPSHANAISTVAQRLGVNPIDLATIISYETMGKFSPNVRGGKNNNHEGLIQFGANERAEFGAHSGQSFEEQMEAVYRYLHKRGARKGDDIKQLYSIVNAGTRDRFKASDGNGTVESHAAKMLREHRVNALRYMTGDSVEIDYQTGEDGAPIINEQTEAALDEAHAQLAKVRKTNDAYFDQLMEEEAPDGELPDKALQIRYTMLQMDRDAIVMFPQLSRQERKQQILAMAQAEAMETGDPSFILAVPQEWLTADERVEAGKMLEQTRKQRVDKILDEERMVGVARQRHQRESLDRMATDMASGALLNPVEYARRSDGTINYEILSAAQALSRVGTVDQTASTAQLTMLENDVFNSATTGDWGQLRNSHEVYRGLGNNPSVDDVVMAIQRDPRMNPQERAAAIQNIRKTMEGANLTQDPVVGETYKDIVASALTMNGGTAAGGLMKEADAAKHADFQVQYNNRVRRGIRSHMRRTGDKPSASELELIAENAAESVLVSVKEWMTQNKVDDPTKPKKNDQAYAGWKIEEVK